MIKESYLRIAHEVWQISQIGALIQKGTYAVETKSDGSAVTIADITMEKRIVDLLMEHFPHIPILTEEGSGTPNLDMTAAIAPGMSGFWSVDPLDGTALFSAGLPDWSVSVVHIQGGRPQFAVVAQPRFGRCFAAERGEGVYMLGSNELEWNRFVREPAPRQMIGLDLATSFAHSDKWWMAGALIRAFRYPRNEPSVFSGVELLLGHTWMWMTTSVAKNWDPAAGALFIEEMGGVAECLDGQPIPWDKIEMPALLFTESKEKAESVRRVLGMV